METKKLIDFLAQNAGPAPPQTAMSKDLALAISGSVLAAAAVSWFAWQPQPAAFFATSTPWIKLFYALLMLGASAWLVQRLSRPIAKIKRPQLVVAGTLLIMFCMSSVSLTLMPTEERNIVLNKGLWLHCSGQIFLTSLPSAALLFWFMRKLAPTQLRIAGAATGLLAGTIGSAIYTIYCSEVASAGMLWYTLGMGLSTLLGFFLGPRLLRW